MIVNFHQINQHFLRFALSLLMGSQKKWLSETIDWEQEIAPFETLDFSYSSYYTLGNITTCLNQVRFQQIISKPILWIYQVTDACKPVTSEQKQKKYE
ncbi:hypothetical protein [Crocosphaera sp. XPORK-15E]|uniref:hypothetical protein n=1 Tax=Crocosphaera sp. XPORK-15E TaxID=3110247 RepID=UPI002B213E3D|nr:hypothetical protein [Crocosphaera sp. XPORK-15E]MEA5536348.1 hypothetical protein [Crocosphaera sp. XPORK-15E]